GDNPARTAAQDLVTRLLPGEPAPAFSFDMLISKPAGMLEETPWHQDWAYSKMPFAEPGSPVSIRSATVWVPLDDVDEENGCMQFVPGAHRTLRRHFIASGDPDYEGRLLATDDFEADEVAVCPVPAGGCTVHTEGTLHY